MGLGIPCRVEGEMIPREFILYSTALFDVKLFVSEEHAEEATLLIEDYRKAVAKEASDESDDAIVFRAFRASVFGIALLPVVLNCFSIWTLRSVRYGALQSISRRRYVTAQVVNGFAVAIGLWVAVKLLG